MASARQALLDTFDLGLLVGDAALCASVYAPNAVVVPPNREMIYGREAIGDYWQRIISRECRAHALTTDQLEVREDRIVERGHYAHFEHPVALDTYTAWGCYVLIMDRHTDGSWAWVADVWSDASEPAIT